MFKIQANKISTFRTTNFQEYENDEKIIRGNQANLTQNGIIS